MKKGFTLIELLVVIAILAVLAVAVVLIINPAELIRQGRDSTRISDMAALNRAIALYLADVATPYLGGPNTACSNAARCTSGTTEFFSGPTTCTTSTARTVDGNGWVTINFNAISSGSPLSQLPIDPNNGATTGKCADGTVTRCFYAYGCNGTNYELNAKMESAKFASSGVSDVESTDGGSQIDLYEVGNKLDL
jgi:prepilin-type N-terminal cleavage/methylation domain-containing protein